MNKSVYSIVLSDSVVRAVDAAAYRLGTSRSNLINRILAQHLSCETREQTLWEAFDYIERTMADTFKIINQTPKSMFSVSSPISFRYRPIPKYAIELLNDKTARLKVSFRTSNAEFMRYLGRFYEFYEILEKKYVPSVSCTALDGKYIRIINNATGEAISKYIKTFDSHLKFFFEHIDEPAAALTAIENGYRKGELVL